MSIGSSRGAFYDDAFLHAILGPDTGELNTKPNDPMIQDEDIIHRDPVQIEQVKNDKNSMPFPNNINPDSSFDSRFGRLPPSGVLGDLKQTTSDLPLFRKLR